MTLFKRVFNTHANDTSSAPTPSPPVEEPEVERAFDQEFSSSICDVDDRPTEHDQEGPRGGAPWARDYNLLLHPAEDEALVKETSKPESVPEPEVVQEQVQQTTPIAARPVVTPTMAERATEAQNQIAASMARRGVQEKPQAAPFAQPEPAEPQAVAAPAPSPSPDTDEPAASLAGPRPGRNARRVRTRMLGFDPGAEATTDPFATTTKESEAPKQVYPVGWMVVAAGPGAGHSFALFNGVSTIGRGTDQSVALDFGDTSISREKHAAVAYDDESNSFFLGHGGKSNIVRLNNRPVLSTEDLTHGDTVRIGETTLRFVALCGSDFSWGKPANGDA